MESMRVIAANMKSLSEVSRGRNSFDITAVKNMLTEIENKVVKTSILFQVNATNPTLEDASEIWANFQDFTEKAFAM